MARLKRIISLITIGAMSFTLLTGCNRKADSTKVLNIYNVGDYIDESLIEKFQQEIAFILWLIFTPSAPEKHIQNTAGSCWPCESNVILD